MEEPILSIARLIGTMKTQNFSQPSIPDWVQSAVFYQIFPDRFARGREADEGADVQEWGGGPNDGDRKGGDLAGILRRFDYLCDLGINALYLNPIFAAESNHGYDTTDYHKVDPHFGTEEQLKQLLRQAHSNGWHVILDGVFNHTGLTFAPFADLVEKGEQSHYKDWYFCHKFPLRLEEGQDTYECWNGNYQLPKLNVANPETRDFLLEIATYWIREFDIDGWRLDAANEVDPEFWRRFRTAVRAVKPDAYLVGEIWQPASEWLQGDRFDGVTNYPWRGAVLDFFALEKSRPSAFDQALIETRKGVSADVPAFSFNLIGGHDTERIRTVCQNDPLRHGQIVLFQMTYPGVPTIYYGDEVGIAGGADPDNRRAMPWAEEQWDRGQRDFYKKVITARHKHSALQDGNFETLVVDDERGVYGFVRCNKAERALILFNRSTNPVTVSLPGEKVGNAPLQDWLEIGIEFKQEAGQTQVTLPARGLALLGSMLRKGKS
ncbi:MAG: hypothetical protein JWN14_376 [Chthonomonadales bacterium]|nr:hypothetical protein [Chthonomonadales bacterium]